MGAGFHRRDGGLLIDVAGDDDERDVQAMFLDQIVSQTRADLEQRKSELPLEDLQHLAAAQPPPLRATAG